ncbi:MAG TPA: DUF397 domain-containing protein [Thermopolyspora sp.]|jgi:Domain of unknown function (DUF397).
MDLSGAQWRKSSYSAHDGGECVEAAGNLRGLVAVRDSKNPNGPTLTLTPGEWRAFLRDVRNGVFG